MTNEERPTSTQLEFVEILITEMSKAMGFPPHLLWNAVNWTEQRYFAHSIYPSEHPRGG